VCEILLDIVALLKNIPCSILWSNAISVYGRNNTPYARFIIRVSKGSFWNLIPFSILLMFLNLADIQENEHANTSKIRLVHLLSKVEQHMEPQNIQESLSVLSISRCQFYIRYLVDSQYRYVEFTEERSRSYVYIGQNAWPMLSRSCAWA